MKVLNLYACLGGNRLLWDEVTDIEVTAIELDPELARMYQERFPNDKVIVTDAHQYLLDHYQEFDFIWSSPPCPTHSRVRVSQKNEDFFIPKFPDMKLYEEIIFLETFFKGKYVVENVIPYYTPLINAKKRGRHLYWTNFNLQNQLGERKKDNFITCNFSELEAFHKIDLSSYKGKQSKTKIARNLVDYVAGKSVFETACGILNREDPSQTQLF